MIEFDHTPEEAMLAFAWTLNAGSCGEGPWVLNIHYFAHNETFCVRYGPDFKINGTSAPNRFWSARQPTLKATINQMLDDL